jgi:hypothetical protein
MLVVRMSCVQGTGKELETRMKFGHKRLLSMWQET